MPAEIARTAPAAERNKEPILAVLRQVLPKTGLVLEIASGTGQHAVYFAAALSGLTWQPSDPDAESRILIEAWIAKAGLQNVLPPLALNVHARPWPLERADAVVCINMIHISPWQATLDLMSGAARLLGTEGVLFLYGPFRRFGEHTATSNEVFDASLRARNSEWGVRDIEAVGDVASNHSFSLEQVVEMPANNLSVVFRRSAPSDG
jgi:SAM-dependent methyltransferase